MAKKEKYILIILLVLLVGFGKTICAKEASEIAKKAFPSVVMIMTEDKNGQPLSLGSGFFVKNDIVATNLHVIEGSTGGYVKLIGQKNKYDIEGYVAIDSKMDLILLKIKDVASPIVVIGDSSKTEIGNEIFAIGNPQGLEGTFSQGIISAIRNLSEYCLFQITAPISPGSSGGPVLNRDGEVIGVSVATFQSGQNLNFAVPSKYLSNLINNIKPVEKLASKENAKVGGKSILADFGGSAIDGVVGEKFLWDHPSLPTGFFSFTLRNQLRESIQKIVCLVVFYDNDGRPIDIAQCKYEGVIPGKLAKRITGLVDKSTQEIVSQATSSTKVEFRILDFQFAGSED